MRSPGERVAQVKLRLSSISVTCQTVGRSLGCRTSAVLPTADGPLSRRFTLSIVGVHSGQRSTSRNTAKTVSGGASMVTVFKVLRLTKRSYESEKNHAKGAGGHYGRLERHRRGIRAQAGAAVRLAAHRPQQGALGGIGRGTLGAAWRQRRCVGCGLERSCATGRCGHEDRSCGEFKLVGQ